MDTERRSMMEMLANIYIVKNAQEIIKSGISPRIAEFDFTDTYQSDEVKRDLAEVNRMEAVFAEETEKKPKNERDFEKNKRLVSEAMEIALAWGGEAYGWFGQNTMTIRTSKFDDIKNGVDLVIEFEIEEERSEPERLALSVDVTMSTDISTLDKKMENNFAKIQNQKFARIKYFESPTTGERGPIENIIPVTVALGGENAVEFITRFTQTMRKGKELGKAEKEEMQKHPAQIIFLKEILMQLNAYAGTLNQNNTHNVKLIGEINNIQRLLEAVLDEKSDIDSSELEGDQSFNRIKKNVNKWLGF